MTDSELLDHLLRLWKDDEPLIPTCAACAELLRRLDALQRGVPLDPLLQP